MTDGSGINHMKYDLAADRLGDIVRAAGFFDILT